MNKYKTYEELKEELGDKFEEYMYKANIELLTKIDNAIERLEALIVFWEKYNPIDNTMQVEQFKGVIEILKEDK